MLQKTVTAQEKIERNVETNKTLMPEVHVLIIRKSQVFLLQSVNYYLQVSSAFYQAQ